MGPLQLAYPAVALVVGALLYRRYPASYVGFVWWLWFLTPEVRRLVDYQLGYYNPTSPVMLAPFLVTALSFYTLLRHLPKLQIYRFIPFGLVLLGLLYGFNVGVLNVGPFGAAFDLLNWLLPVVFAFHLLVHWRSYPHFGRAIQRTFAWGVLVMGAYGLVQYFYVPVWDEFWMLNSGMASIGVPEPFEVRIFSTLNSPGPFAGVMMAGLLLLLSGGGAVRLPAAAVGYASFLLSLVRAAWGAWLVGLLCMVAQSGRSRPRLLATVVVMAVITLPLLTVGPVAQTVDERLQTLTGLEEDQSFEARLEFYKEFLPSAFLSPVGAGMGSTGVSTKLSTSGELASTYANFDSGVMNIPFVLGWPGSLLYTSGLIWLLLNAWRGSGSRHDLLAAASWGIAVAVLAQLVFANTLVGVSGMVFWSFLGLSLAARLYHANAAEVAAKPREYASAESVGSLQGDGR